MNNYAPKRDAELLAVAAAALAWNRARLRRAAIERCSASDWRHSDYSPARVARGLALKAEARALAELRKACRIADPLPVVVDVDAAPPKTKFLNRH